MSTIERLVHLAERYGGLHVAVEDTRGGEVTIVLGGIVMHAGPDLQSAIDTAWEAVYGGAKDAPKFAESAAAKILGEALQKAELEIAAERKRGIEVDARHATERAKWEKGARDTSEAYARAANVWEQDREKLQEEARGLRGLIHTLSVIFGAKGHELEDFDAAARADAARWTEELIRAREDVRDGFARAALGSVYERLQQAEEADERTNEECALVAYSLADAMMWERAKTRKV